MRHEARDGGALYLCSGEIKITKYFFTLNFETINCFASLRRISHGQSTTNLLIIWWCVTPWVLNVSANF